jgi:hypothetical protein
LSLVNEGFENNTEILVVGGCANGTEMPEAALLGLLGAGSTF